MKTIYGVLALVVLSTLLGCSRGCSGCKKTQPTEETQALQELTVGGVVTDDLGNPIENAFVTARIDANGDGMLSPDESFSTITDKNGYFLVTGRIITARILTGRILTARVQVSIEKEGFARNSVVIEPSGYGYIGSFKMARAHSAVDRNPKDGVQFSLVKGPAGAPRLVAGLSRAQKLRLKQEGSDILVDINIPPELVPESESISANVAWVDPTTDPDLMPGSFLAYSDRPIMLSSAGFISVEMQNERGEEIRTLSPRIKTRSEEQKAVIRMKIPESAVPTLYDYVEDTTDKVEVPMWYFDERTQVWLPGEELGVMVDEKDNVITPRELAKITTGNLRKSIYVRASVEHFSEWNVDYPITTHSSLCGQIVDAQGKGVGGLHVTTQGKTYGGLGDWKGTYTDPNGNFCVDVKKSDPENPGGGKGECFDELRDSATIYDFCKDMIFLAGGLPFTADVAAIENAVDELKRRKLIDDVGYNSVKRLLDGAQADIRNGEFGKANDKIRDALNALSPIGRQSADQIFYERWDEIGTEGMKLLLDTLASCGLDIIKNKAIANAIKKLNLSECEQFGGEFLLDFGKSLVDFGRAVTSGEADTSTLVEYALDRFINFVGNESFQKCIGQALPEGGGFDICIFSFKDGKFGLNAKAGSLAFVAQTLGTLAAQGLLAWGEHGEWKSAKAYEMVHPYFEAYLKNYNEFLRKLRSESSEFYKQCKDLLSRECAYFKPRKSPRIRGKQEANSVVVFAEMISGFLRLREVMDKILLGGHETIARWSVRCQETQEGYICENSPRVMNCETRTFSERLTGFYCIETDRVAKTQFDKTRNSFFAYVDVPPERRGGETRSMILIDGKPVNFFSDIGINWSNVGSPTLNSTAHKFDWWFYVPEEVKRNPSRYIGKIKLNISEYKIKGRLIDKQKRPISSERVSLSCGKVGKWAITDKDGYFEISIISPESSCSLYVPSKVIDIQLVHSPEIDLGNITINIPPRIKSVLVPPQAPKGKDISLSAEVEDPDSANLSYRWFANGKPIGNAKDIKYRIREQSSICLSVSDEESSKTECEFIYVDTSAPLLILLSVPDEIEEGKTYTLQLSAADPDSEENELRFSTYSYDPDVGILDSLSISPKIYVSNIRQDKNVEFIFYVCDETWRCDRKTKIIRVKNVAKTPYVKIYASKNIGLVGDVITFQAEATNSETFRWNFGDGDVRTTSNPFVQKSFSKEGVYTVSVEARSEDDITAQDSVLIEIGASPRITSFSASPTEGSRPLRIDFALNAENAESFVWNFGDGYASTSQTPTMSHVYTKTGNFTVQVRANNKYGSSSTHTDIFVRNISPTIDSFTANPQSGSAPLTVEFSVRVTDEYRISRYVFVFGDGFQRTITTESFSVSTTHTYSTAGTFSASVAVYDDEGGRDTRTITVTVLSPQHCDKPSVSLTADPSSGVAPLDVTLTASVTYSLFPISKYQWDFGDDGTIDLESTSPSINIKFYSSKKIRVRAVNSCGNYGTAITLVMVLRQRHSSDFFTPISSCVIPSSISNSNFAVGDFNGDGKQDVVVPYVPGYFGILTGDGNGKFSVAVAFPEDQCPRIFLADDFTGDSKPDIVITCAYMPETIVLYRNDSYASSISFTKVSESPVPAGNPPYGMCRPYTLMSSDFNSDGKKDIFVGCSGYSYYAYGDGTSFPSFISLGENSLGWTPDAVIADFNSDGKPDIAGVNSDHNYVYIARNTGSGFDTSAPIPVTYPKRIEAGDFNSDGKTDIVVYRSNLTYVSESTRFILELYINESSGDSMTFSLSTIADATIAYPVHGIEFKVAELNLDTTPDYLYTAYRLYPPKITEFTLVISRSDDQFPTAGSTYFSSIQDSGFIGLDPSLHIEIADFTSDGFTDVMLIHENGCVVVFKRKTYLPSPVLHDKKVEIDKDASEKYGCSVIPVVFAAIPAFIFFAVRRARKNPRN